MNRVDIETTHTVVEAVYYLLSKLGPATKIKILKLIYLADKYHLIRYGRTITEDDYYALKHGPICSSAKDVLDFNGIRLSAKGIEYFSQLIEEEDDRSKRYPDYMVKKTAGELDRLSETDEEAIDFVVKKFGHLPVGKLLDYTHKYPEWAQHEESLKSGLTKSELIRTEELLSVLPDDDPLAMPPEHIEESRRILTGQYE